MTGTSSTGIAVPGEQLAHLELDELGQLVVGHVGLAQRDDDVPDPDLLGQEHVLTGLRHDAVVRGHHQDGPVDLSRAGDHVLHVAGVTGHVHVRVMPGRGLVLDVRDVDGDAAGGLFRRPVDAVGRHVGRHPALGEHLGDGRRERGFAVVDVTHGADVQVRLGPLVGLPGHVPSPGWAVARRPAGMPTLPRGVSRPRRGRVSLACRQAGPGPEPGQPQRTRSSGRQADGKPEHAFKDEPSARAQRDWFSPGERTVHVAPENRRCSIVPLGSGGVAWSACAGGAAT